MRIDFGLSARRPADRTEVTNISLIGRGSRARRYRSASLGRDDTGFVGQHDRCARSRSPSLLSTLPTWVLTVCSAKNSAPAISALDMPVAMSSRTRARAASDRPGGKECSSALRDGS